MSDAENTYAYQPRGKGRGQLLQEQEEEFGIRHNYFRSDSGKINVEVYPAKYGHAIRPVPGEGKIDKSWVSIHNAPPAFQVKQAFGESYSDASIETLRKFVRQKVKSPLKDSKSDKAQELTSEWLPLDSDEDFLNDDNDFYPSAKYSIIGREESPFTSTSNSIDKDSISDEPIPFDPIGSEELKHLSEEHQARILKSEPCEVSNYPVSLSKDSIRERLSLRDNKVSSLPLSPHDVSIYQQNKKNHILCSANLDELSQGYNKIDISVDDYTKDPNLSSEDLLNTSEQNSDQVSNVEAKSNSHDELSSSESPQRSNCIDSYSDLGASPKITLNPLSKPFESRYKKNYQNKLYNPLSPKNPTSVLENFNRELNLSQCRISNPKAESSHRSPLNTQMASQTSVNTNYNTLNHHGNLDPNGGLFPLSGYTQPSPYSAANGIGSIAPPIYNSVWPPSSPKYIRILDEVAPYEIFARTPAGEFFIGYSDCNPKYC